MNPDAPIFLPSKKKNKWLRRCNQCHQGDANFPIDKLDEKGHQRTYFYCKKCRPQTNKGNQ